MILATADWHLTDLPRDSYRHKWQAELLHFVHKYKPKAVLINGDITEAKDEHSAQLTNAVADHVHQLSQLTEVVIIMGNHDYAAEDAPFFAFLRHMPHVEWVGRPMLCTGDHPLASLRAMLLPHTRSPEQDWKDLPFRQAEWVFAHAAFAGASENGRALSGIDPKLAGDKRIIAGDVHTPQEFGPVTYIGAPYTVDFGDDYKPRVLLVDKDGYKSVPCTGPQKRLIEVDSLEKLRKARVSPDDIVKVRLNLPGTEQTKRQEVADAVYGWGEKQGINIYQLQTVFHEKVEIRPAAKVDRMSDQELLTSYARERGVDKVTLAIGREIIDAT